MFENRSLVNLALGRSTVRQHILALLLEQPRLRLHLREIQRRAATSPGTASRELARLVAAGLVDREPEGNQVYFRASDSPAAALLLSLLSGTRLPTAQSPAGPTLPAVRARASRPGASSPRRPSTSNTVAESAEPSLPAAATSQAAEPSRPAASVAAPEPGLIASTPAVQAAPAANAIPGFHVDPATPFVPLARPRSAPTGPGTGKPSPTPPRVFPAPSYAPPKQDTAPVTEQRPRLPADLLGILPGRQSHAGDASPADARSRPATESAPDVPGLRPDATPHAVPAVAREAAPAIGHAAPVDGPPIGVRSAIAGIPHQPVPGPSATGSRGNVAPPPEGQDLEALVTAIRKRGPVDELAARAGAMLAPSLRWLYGERLSAAYLFGDRATGRTSPTSPVQLLIVLDRIERYGEEVERTSLAFASVSLELEVVVSRVFLAEADWFLRPSVRSLPTLAGALKL
jgi:DNA-binding transcriptional ArsR family regulator